MSAASHIRRLVPAVLAVAALSLAMAPSASAAQACSSAAAVPGVATHKDLVKATLCLLNRERRAHGLKRLRLNRRLSRAARAHARDMVFKTYFSHDSLGGASFVDRIRHTGYLRAARFWLVGENLAWGSGDRSSPESTVDAWMHSPGHRENILTARFREIGIGVAFGAPNGDRDEAATYATDFGRKR